MAERNPRKNVPADKMCQYMYPEGHAKEGRQCGAIRKKGSIYCNYHQPDKTALLKQLEEARDKRKHPPNEKHGYYTKPENKLGCDNCGVGDGCNYYVQGKATCDYSIKPVVDLDNLSDIEKFARDIVTTEYSRYKKLEPAFNMEQTNLDLHEVSSRTAKRMTSILKDYAAIKALYEKNRKISGWESILGK